MMSARDQAEHLAERLLEARARHQPADLPADCFGQLDEATAMRIQQLTVERLHAAVAGWKVAVLPDGAVLAAPILDFLLYRNAASVPDRLRGSGGIECEIAFRIGQLLPARARYPTAEPTWKHASTALSLPSRRCAATYPQASTRRATPCWPTCCPTQASLWVKASRRGEIWILQASQSNWWSMTGPSCDKQEGCRPAIR